MPGHVKLTNAYTGNPYYLAIDLIKTFQAAANLSAEMSRRLHAPDNDAARTMIQTKGSGLHPHWVTEAPEMVNSRICAELCKCGLT